MKLYITPEARRDLETIGDWIAADNPERAITFIQELRSSIAEILHYPEKYPLAAQFEGKRLRRKVHGNYLIFYRVKSAQVEVIHVLNGAQDQSRFLD